MIYVSLIRHQFSFIILLVISPLIHGFQFVQFWYVSNRREQKDACANLHGVIPEYFIYGLLVVNDCLWYFYQSRPKNGMVDVLIRFQPSVDTIEECRFAMRALDSRHLWEYIPYPVTCFYPWYNFFQCLLVRTYIVTIIYPSAVTGMSIEKTF